MAIDIYLKEDSSDESESEESESDSECNKKQKRILPGGIEADVLSEKEVDELLLKAEQEQAQMPREKKKQDRVARELEERSARRQAWMDSYPLIRGIFLNATKRGPVEMDYLHEILSKRLIPQYSTDLDQALLFIESCGDISTTRWHEQCANLKKEIYAGLKKFSKNGHTYVRREN